MPVARQSQWARLLDLSLGIVDQATSATYPFAWTFGGGTALMLQIDHRESHDVDLFFDDPQLLPFLNPTTQDYRLSRRPDSYRSDGSHVAKLIFDGMGEIDFICCGSVTTMPALPHEIAGRTIRLETPGEIVAKKIQYRGARLQPRDMFDVAAVIDRCGEGYVVDAMRACGLERCAEALSVVDAMDPAFASAVMAQLMLREHARHLLPKAQSSTRAVLHAALDR
jgi:hypothetical protein